MPRIARGQLGGVCGHVINRGNGRQEVFHDSDDYAALLELIGLACRRVPMREDLESTLRPRGRPRKEATR